MKRYKWNKLKFVSNMINATMLLMSVAIVASIAGFLIYGISHNLH